MAARRLRRCYKITITEEFAWINDLTGTIHMDSSILANVADLSIMNSL